MENYHTKDGKNGMLGTPMCCSRSTSCDAEYDQEEMINFGLLIGGVGVITGFLIAIAVSPKK